MIGDCVFQAKATEPAVSKVEMYLFAQTSFGANAEAVAHNQHADHELRIDRRPTGVAVVRCEVLAKSIEVEVAINTAQQVRTRNMVIKVKGVEEFVLTTTLLTHHDVHPRRSMSSRIAKIRFGGEFFNRIGHILPFSERTTLPLERLQYSGTCRTSCVNNSANAAVCAGTFVARLSP
ncbi:hypothetical protein WQE_00110 [Paraburkholderia hospita]|uniref:Uncharacterized protein n=1 Tax=Paraburkholderia hospita TaxID=169430 RepID=A0ABN0FWC6_9BURK|nr:hypothetical protein WQE_00110 [Paraburkholderia hospita]